MLCDNVHEFHQSRQINERKQAASHLRTEIWLDHPNGNGLSSDTIAQFEIFGTMTAKLPHSAKSTSPKKRVKRVENNNFPLVTGIIMRWL